MPLIHSSSNEARSKNIEEMIKSGHDPKQAEAAAYAEQRSAAKDELETAQRAARDEEWHLRVGGMSRDELNVERQALDTERLRYELQRTNEEV